MRDKCILPVSPRGWICFNVDSRQSSIKFGCSTKLVERIMVLMFDRLKSTLQRNIRLFRVRKVTSLLHVKNISVLVVVTTKIDTGQIIPTHNKIYWQ